MSKVAFLSFNTGGTLGHMTLLSRMANFLTDNHEVHILSDYGCKRNSFTKNPKIKWERFPEEITINSNGGQVAYKSSEKFLEYCKKENISYVVYSTFFDPELVNNLKRNGIKNIYISYPLRDTFSELFFLRENNILFDHVIILKDLIDHNYPNSVRRCNPLFLPYLENEVSANKILLTCGGGGRPSSVNFLQIMSEYINLIRKEFPTLEITLIKGPNNKQIEIPEVEVIEYTDEIREHIDSSKIVISEAGYFTTHELISRSKPSILIPGARRIDNQELRAIEYEKRKLGYCFMPEEDIGRLVTSSVELLSDRSLYSKMQHNCGEYYSSFSNHDNLENVIGGIFT